MFIAEGLSIVLHCMLFSTASAAASADAGPGMQAPLTQTEVFVSGSEGYHTFRIPALAVTPSGTLLAFCEGRKTSREDLGNNDLMLKRSMDGGRTWGGMQLVYEEGGDAKITIGNPTVVVDEDTKTIWLILLRNGSEILVTHSRDEGNTWAGPRDITADVKRREWGFYAVGPGVGIQVRHGPHAGRLVIPAYHRTTPDKSGPSTAHVFFSDDHGATWTLGGSAGLHTNECQVVELLRYGRSELLLNMRNHWGRSGGRSDLAGVRLVSRSPDGGLTWSEPTADAKLIEPTCQASILRYSWAEGEKPGRVLFSNPASRNRQAMTVRLSYDDGRTWPVSRLIEPGSAAYSCLARLPDGCVGLLYERDDYRTLRFVKFTLSWLTGGNEPR